MMEWRHGDHLQIIMRSKQQKQIESGGEFEEICDEIETLNTESFVPMSRKKPNSKSSPSEKIKLGVYSSTYLSEFSSPKMVKPAPQTHGKVLKVGSATFRSNYECGQIGAVELVGVNHFKITLDYETNSTRGNTWFYFTVEGIRGEAKFDIDGFSKATSLYNSGMKICYKDGKEGKWRRGGLNISYANAAEEEEEKNYQLRFTYFFKSNEPSSVEFAYAFPYGLAKLQSLINTVQSVGKVHSLGRSYQNRQIPLVTLGNANSKELIILSARVHPGETCSSFIMEGLLKELISENCHSKFLREHFCFKIIPMINVDGVASGNYRFSGAGVDLNRKWKQPSDQYHPEVFYLKEMILKESKLRTVRLYIDMHGHSRKKNVFFYGCSRNSEEIEEYTQAKAFPYLMSKLHPAFSYFDCSFNIQREKEGTARVALWKELKIHEIFTLEASMCGSEVGSNYTEVEYERIGKKLCEGISIYFSSQARKDDISMQKLCRFNESVVESLRSDPMLLKVGSFEGSGSQSEPEKGEAAKREETGQSRNRLKMSSLHSNLRQMQKQRSYKQKEETALPDDKELVREKEMLEYFFDIPSQARPDHRKPHPPPMFTTKRINSLSRNGHFKTAKSTIFQDSIEVGEERSVEKTKTNLLVGWEGAQYRRVRKMAEQSWKRGSSLGDFEVKGLRGNKIEIEQARTLIPKLSLSAQQNKHRKTTAEMYFSKHSRWEERTPLAPEQMGVLCRGRQIPL